MVCVLYWAPQGAEAGFSRCVILGSGRGGSRIFKAAAAWALWIIIQNFKKETNDRYSFHKKSIDIQFDFKADSGGREACRESKLYILF